MTLAASTWVLLAVAALLLLLMCLFCRTCTIAVQAGCRTRRFRAGVTDAIATAPYYTPMASPRQSTQVPMISSDDLEELESLGHGLTCATAKGVYHGRQVLIKTFRYFGRFDDFGRHVQTYYQLRSPYLVALLGVADTASAQPKLIFEYMDGSNLSDYVSSNTNVMSPVTIALAVAKGLEHLHGHHVAHGGINVSSIRMATDGRIKLPDFGFSYEAAYLATLPPLAGMPEIMRDPPQTPHNYWMAPYSKGADTAAADIFSFGIMMIELLWLATHDTMDLFGTAMLHIRAGRATTDLLKVPDDWYFGLALRCVARDPLARPTATEIVQLLQQQQTEDEHVV